MRDVDHLLWNSLCSGPNIYSQSLSSLSGDIETPFSLTTTGHQLLLRWSSDHGTNRRGFHIRYVGEYQSMYPAYNHILLFWMLFQCFLSQNCRQVIKVMGLQFGQSYFRHYVESIQLSKPTQREYKLIFHSCNYHQCGYNVTPWFLSVCCDCFRLFTEFLISVIWQTSNFPQIVAHYKRCFHTQKTTRLEQRLHAVLLFLISEGLNC